MALSEVSEELRPIETSSVGQSSREVVDRLVHQLQFIEEGLREEGLKAGDFVPVEDFRGTICALFESLAGYGTGSADVNLAVCIVNDLLPWYEYEVAEDLLERAVARGDQRAGLMLAQYTLMGFFPQSGERDPIQMLEHAAQRFPQHALYVMARASSPWREGAYANEARFFDALGRLLSLGDTNAGVLLAYLRCSQLGPEDPVTVAAMESLTRATKLEAMSAERQRSDVQDVLADSAIGELRFINEAQLGNQECVTLIEDSLL
jgi:hypothetical protein